MAEEFMNAQRYERAGPIFLGVASDDAAGDTRPVALLLATECMKRLEDADLGRPECAAQMAEALDRFTPELCTPPPRLPSALDACSRLRRAAFDLERKRADQIFVRADRGGPLAAETYRQAGGAYRTLVDRRCLDPRGIDPISLGCDEVLYAAYRAFVAAGARHDADDARARLLDPKNGMVTSPLAKLFRKLP